MDRTTKDAIAPVPLKITDYYLILYLDLDILFVNNVAFCIVKLRNIRFIHYKATEDMESNYFTKALNGNLFHTYRTTLMRLDGINEYMFYKK